MDEWFLAQCDRTVCRIVACRHEGPFPRLKGPAGRNGDEVMAVAHHQGKSTRRIQNDGETGTSRTRATADDGLSSVAGKRRHDEGLEREGRKPVKDRCGGDDRVGTGIDALTGAVVESVGRRIHRNLAIGSALGSLDTADDANGPEFEGLVVFETDLEINGVARPCTNAIRVAQDASAVIEGH